MKNRAIGWLWTWAKSLKLVAAILMFSSAAEEQTFRDSSGKVGRYTIERPSKTSRLGVLVFFHGSGATSSYASNFPDFSKIAKKFDLAPVALQAPDGVITWAEKGPESGRVPYAQELLRSEVFGKSPSLDAQKVVFVGISAGSTFIAGDFLPVYVKDYGGGAVLLCGGAPPQYPRKIRASLGGFKMFVAIQPTDFLFSQTIMGVDFWRNQGLTVKTVQPPGSGHCGFDLNTQMIEGITYVLGRSK